MNVGRKPSGAEKITVSGVYWSGFQWMITFCLVLHDPCHVLSLQVAGTSVTTLFPPLPPPPSAELEVPAAAALPAQAPRSIPPAWCTASGWGRTGPSTRTRKNMGAVCTALTLPTIWYVCVFPSSTCQFCPHIHLSIYPSIYLLLVSMLQWQQGMHGTEFSHFDYQSQYPSALKTFHNWGLGALDSAVYAPGTFPQDWPGLGDPPFSKVPAHPSLPPSLYGSDVLCCAVL
jgi:hypothetical protein